MNNLKFAAPRTTNHEPRSTATLPPLDPDLAPQVADADVRRRADYLRRRLAEGVLCGSMKRLTEHELRDAEHALLRITNHESR